MSEAEKLSIERIFDGKVFDMDRDRVRMPNGREVTVDVVRHPRSVVLLPIPDPDKIVLIRQYRYAVNRWLWELPAGSVDEGERRRRRRGASATRRSGRCRRRSSGWRRCYPTPGYCDEEMLFFRLSGLSTPAEAATPDEDEDIEARTFASPRRAR